MKKIKSMFLLSLILVATVFTFVFTSNIQISNAEDLADYSQTKIAHTYNKQTHAVVFSYRDIIFEYYNDFIEYILTKDTINNEVPTFDEFYNSFFAQNSFGISDFTEHLKYLSKYAPIDFAYIPIAPTAFAAATWRNDIGTRPLLNRPEQGRFAFNLMPGDILFQEKGFPLLGLVGLGGHIAMVEGRFRDPNYGYFWRLIESHVRNAVLPGVSRHLLDDYRFINSRAHILRVRHATAAQRQGAVDFALSQYGKNWRAQTTRPLYSNYWMCSTLIWAAYMNQGIDIAPGSGIVTPENIYDSSVVGVVERYNTGSVGFNFEQIGSTNNLRVRQSNESRMYNRNRLEIPSHTFFNGNRRPVTEIADNGFQDFRGTEIIIPDSIRTIGANAFEGFRGTTISIPSSIISIGANAFSNFQGTAITLPPAVTTIGTNAFPVGVNINWLEVINYDTTIQNIGLAFESTPAGRVPTGGHTPSRFAVTDFVIPPHSIFRPNFAGTISIPEGVTSIATNVFNGNQAIYHVHIASTVTTIGNSAFENTTNLFTVEFAEGSHLSHIGANAFRNSSLMTNIAPASLTLTRILCV